jgi:uncharacterized protein (TIGR03067 family)
MLRFAFAATLLTALAHETTPADDAKRLVGAWKIVAAEVNGEKQAKIVGHRLVFDGKSLAFEDARGTAIPPKTRYLLRPDKTPREIDIVRRGGAEEVSLGIYALDGDRLKVCYAKAGNPRPKDFTTKDGDGRALAFLERVVPKR